MHLAWPFVLRLVDIGDFIRDPTSTVYTRLSLSLFLSFRPRTLPRFTVMFMVWIVCRCCPPFLLRKSSARIAFLWSWFLETYLLPRNWHKQFLFLLLFSDRCCSYSHAPKFTISFFIGQIFDDLLYLLRYKIYISSLYFIYFFVRKRRIRDSPFRFFSL